MISRPKPRLLKFGIAVCALGLAGCGSSDPDLGPIDRAREALSVGDAVQAEVILRNEIAAGTDQSEVAALLGEAELQQGQLAEARQWLKDGLFSPETKAHGFHMLGRLEMEAGNLPAAGRAFDRALAADDKRAGLWVDIARLRYRGGEQTMAVEASIHAVELDPGNPRALQLRAQLIRESQGMAAALPWFERALEHNPKNTDLLYDYAATLGELGRAHDMLAVIRKIAENDPAERRIYYLQAVLAARAGKFELARSLLLRANKATQDMPAGKLLSGIIDMENGNYASAAQALEQLAAKQPDNRRVRDMLARALSLSGSDKELVYRFGEAAMLADASPYLKTLVGRSYEAMDEREKAAVFLDLAARPRPGRLVAMQARASVDAAELRGSASGRDALELARARIAAGQADAAMQAVKPYLENFPGSADALALAGDTALAAGRYRRAIERYEAASKIRSPWTTKRKLFAALERAGRERDALILLARHFVGDPGNVEAAGLLARVAIENDDWNAAAIFLDHAIENGGHGDPILLSLRAEVALKQGDIRLAIADAESAYAIQPLSRESTRILAMAYRASGDHETWAIELEDKLARMPAS